MSVKQVKNGFSIIEVLIGLAAIGAVLLIYQAASNSLILEKDVKHQDLALRIAASKMEELRNLPFASLPTSGSFSHAQMGDLPAGSANLTMSDFNSKTKQAEVVVSWQEAGSDSTHRVNLTTLITQGGL